MFGFLLSPLAKWAGAGALIIAVLGGALIYREVLIHERNSARAEVVTLNARLVVERADEARLQATIKQQNAAVKQLQLKAAVAQKAEHLREKTAAASAAKVRKSAAALASTLMHANTGSGCKAAIRWGVVQARGLSKW